MTGTAVNLRDAWSRVAHEYRKQIVPDFLPAAGMLCRAVEVGPADLVLDIACGPGTAAFAAHDLGAGRTVGVDFALEMVRLARTESAELARVRFAAADALALPFASGQFDVVVSSFGLVFAPDPNAAAAEAARVLRPGGRLGLLAWPPGGSVGTYQQLLLRYFEPPPGTHDAFQWGTVEQARAWLTRFDPIELVPLEVPFRAGSPEEAWRILRTVTGRVASGYEALTSAARARLDRDMSAFFASFGTADGICWRRDAVIIRGVRQ